MKKVIKKITKSGKIKYKKIMNITDKKIKEANETIEQLGSLFRAIEYFCPGILEETLKKTFPRKRKK